MSGYIGTQPVPQATQTRDAFTCTAGQTSFATSGYTPSFLDVYLNGIKLAAADYTASNGSDVVLASGAALNDILEVVAYSTFESADHYTQAEADAEFVQDPNGAITVSGSNVGIGTSSPEEKLHVQGSLKVDFGSAGGNPRVYLDHDSATDDGNYLQLNRGDDSLEVVGQDNVKIRTNGTERMRLDSAGRVTMPYQPAFCAYKSVVGNTSYGAGSIVSADMADTKYNVGGHYNTSNGRFTAPIGGLYLFWCSLYNNSSAATRIRCDINGGGGAWGQGNSAANSDWAITGVAKLNAGDYVNLTSAYAGTTVFQDIHHSSWGGYLIG